MDIEIETRKQDQICIGSKTRLLEADHYFSNAVYTTVRFIQQWFMQQWNLYKNFVSRCGFYVKFYGMCYKVLKYFVPSGCVWFEDTDAYFPIASS
jgi:uncharacterized protein (DUF608 family)